MVLCLIILRRKAKSGHILVGKIKSKIYVMSFLLFAVPFLSVLFDVQESTFWESFIHELIISMSGGRGVGERSTILSEYPKEEWNFGKSMRASRS